MRPSTLVPWLSLSLSLSGCAATPGPAGASGDEQGEVGVADEAGQTAQPRGTLEALDAALRESWSAAGVEPSPLADDAEYLRRVSLDLIGRVPTRGEVERFLADDASDKRAGLVDALLASEDHAAYWAGRWAGRLLPDDRRTKRVAEGPLEGYLSQALHENRPWTEVVDALLTGEGELDDAPQLGFLAARAVRGQGREAAVAELSSTTARVFLGARIECAQCHDHPYVDFSREDFWATAAYFGRTKVNMVRGEGPPKVTVSERPKGQLRVALQDDADARKQVVRPRYMGAAAVDADPPAETTDTDSPAQRRDRLAAAIIADPRFAEATVGQLWTQLLGSGLVEPWDDLLVHRGERPAALTILAEDFRAHDHDMRRLLRTIVLSQAYQRSSRPSPGVDTSPAATHAREAAFAQAVVRPLGAEQLFASVMTATGLEQLKGRAFRKAVRQREQVALLEYAAVFADDELSSADAAGEGFTGSVPQALLMLNGGLTNQGVIARAGGSLAQILAKSADTDERLRDLWLTVYGRPPRAEELEIGRRAVAAKGGGTAQTEVWEDLMFAALYSTEFSSNH
ncbi:DUF1549 domain-containing protein [Pseudenhygromyxa sp. WMMC2535]|uniref:DUF1549 domain-containing protein n=1 Tax=Pseudenhygromyxa sp. WMMC2535 TaxID=2712867 RepID=UPI001551B17F|nr:DUF1549 domain-containing protein [Pseudenhygromyxa sp. WMMC2535]